MKVQRRSRYVSLLLAGAAVAALTACDDNVMTGPDKDGTIYGTVADCAKEQDGAACTAAFDAAKEEHLRQSPKFATKAECEAAGFQQCETAEVKSADGQSSTSMFMPMMMGYLMGRTLGGPMGGMPMGGPAGGPAGGLNTPPPNDRTAAGGAIARTAAAGRPVYSDRNGYLYANGGTVGRMAPGATSLAGAPTRVTSRGGFGGSARSFSGGS